ncbi:hypothetical protein [Bifidobacterium thermacidophilum]|nr:hypothetical protein [Bifidobacterium thermacidophilum]
MDKIKRTAWDLAAAEFFDSAIESKGLTNKAIERMSDGRMGYNRVRDIRMGLRGPMRLSELITLCTILQISPTETLKKIIARATDEIEAAESVSPAGERLPVPPVSPAPSGTPADDAPDDDAPLSAQEIMTMAANTDPNRDAEAETPRD